MKSIGFGKQTTTVPIASISRQALLIKLGCGDFPMSEAVDEVIVHHFGGGYLNRGLMFMTDLQAIFLLFL
jgi:hypothetical protein